jgi:hypothetical protein
MPILLHATGIFEFGKISEGKRHQSPKGNEVSSDQKSERGSFQSPKVRISSMTNAAVASTVAPASNGNALKQRTYPRSVAPKAINESSNKNGTPFVSFVGEYTRRGASKSSTMLHTASGKPFPDDPRAAQGRSADPRRRCFRRDGSRRRAESKADLPYDRQKPAS